MTGAAIDIGTTTIQAQLVNINTGEVLDSFSALNDQRTFGADVMSRISAAQNGKLKDLYTAINKQIEGILQQFINKNNLEKIEKCAVSGNTVMLHLFCNIDPSSMGVAPYKPVFLEERHFLGSDLSLSAKEIFLLPGISAFIGADIAAGLTEIEIMDNNANAVDSLFVDIGTNGEIAVWKDSEQKLYCCSTAAGSCFEETEISYGMTASGFVDAIAMMRKNGEIDETGLLIKEAHGITQKDIRQFQLAKSAIFSGIKLLCKTAKLDLSNIGRTYIAGSFGEHLNLESAAQTGLLPHEIISKAVVCGNTSLKGAVKSLVDPKFLQRCRNVIRHANVVDLAHDKYFAAAYEHNMWFK